MVQEMLGLCEAKDGTEIDELLQAGARMQKRARHDVTSNSGPWWCRVFAKEAGRSIKDSEMSLR